MAELVLSDGTREYDFLAEPRGLIYVQADGITLPVVSRENTYAETPDSEGRTRIRSRAQNPESGSFSVYFSGSTDSEFWDAIDELQELVESAHQNKGTIQFRPGDAAELVTWDLESISVTDLPIRGVELRQQHAGATVTYEVKPYGRLAEQPIYVNPGYQVAVVALTPAILLPLGGTAGLTDRSGNARNGTAAGGVTIGTVTPGPLTILDEGATNFDGTDDRVTTTYNPFTNATTRTFMGWANRDTSSSNDILVGGSGAATQPMIRLTSGGNDVVFYSAASAATTWAGAWPGNGQWVHWALVFNETTNAVSLYINGVLVSALTQADAYNAAGTFFQIGSRSLTTDPFDGKQAWVSVHESGLTASQILDAYRAGAQPTRVAMDGPIDDLVVSPVPGQVDARGALTVTDTSSQARYFGEIGVQYDYDPLNAEPILLQAVTALTGLSASSNTRSGSYSTNILRSAVTASPVAVCTTGSRPHKGKWKVRTRVYPTASDVRVRLAWRVGDGPFSREKWVAVPGTDGFYDLDLGTINIGELTGTHSWEARIEAACLSGIPTLDIDTVYMIPADSYMKVRGSSSADTSLSPIIAADDFSTQTAGAMSGKTPLLAPAGTWTGAGDADDFVMENPGLPGALAYRNAQGDSALNNGRYLRCGSGILAVTVASVDLGFEFEDGINGRAGVFLRYVDTSNWLMAVYTGVNLVSLIKRVAGTETVLGVALLPGQPLRNRGRRISCAADAAGNVVVYEGSTADTLAPVILVIADTSLATGGALDDGGYGIYDARTAATDNPRRYDNFLVSSLPATASIANPVMNPGRTFELLHDTALTQASAGSAKGTTPIRYGTYLTLPPSTRANRKHRIVTRWRRQDVDSGFPDTGLTDASTASLSVTPRVHLTGS